jgi:quercetin dioxygenase-like cupin family protein
MNEKPNSLIGMPFELKKAIAYAEGSVVSKTLLSKEVGSLTLFAFDAGQGLSEHTSPYDAVVHILDGIAEITIGGERKSVREGQMLIMPAQIPHALHGPDRFMMLLIMIRGSR